MRSLLAVLIALIMLGPIYELKPARAQGINLEYLANYTSPEIIKGQLGGFYVSGGGLYLRNQMTYQPPAFVFQRPKLNVGCGSIDAFLGALGFGGFEWLTSRLQQFIMAAPYVAFKIGLAVLLPQVDSVLSTVEAIINQINNLQVDQCGRITGIDVNFLKDPVKWAKDRYTNNKSAEAAKATGKETPLTHLRNALSNIKAGNLGDAVANWNNLINSVFNEMNFANAGIDIDVDKMPSLVRLVDSKLSSTYVPYLFNSGCLYKVFVGDVILTNNPVRYQSGDGVAIKNLPEPNFSGGAPAYAELVYKKFEAYIKSNDASLASVPLGIPDMKGDCSSSTTISSFPPIPDLRASNFESSIRNIYMQMKNKQPVNVSDTIVSVLASLPEFPALAYIQWAAIADGVGNTSFFGQMAIKDSASVLANYAMCKLVAGSLSALHQALMFNLNELYIRTCLTKTANTTNDSGSGNFAKVPVNAYCEESNYKEKLDRVISELNDNFNEFSNIWSEQCEKSYQEAEEKIEKIRGVAEQAEKLARSRLSRYGVHMANVSIWEGVR